VSSATLVSTTTDKNPIEVVSNRDQTFVCTTNAARPSSRIQWYLSTTNITTSASPLPDVCRCDCSDDKVISSSVLTYTVHVYLAIEGFTIHTYHKNIAWLLNFKH
jgi:hypothetical protein